MGSSATSDSVAIDEGLIGSVDDLELAARNPRFREITLPDLLTMSSGIRYEEGGFPSFGDDTYVDLAPSRRGRNRLVGDRNRL
jgi:CubicO group peptidase (beta-lactamase class C family)